MATTQTITTTDIIASISARRIRHGVTVSAGTVPGTRERVGVIVSHAADAEARRRTALEGARVVLVRWTAQGGSDWMSAADLALI